MLCYVHSNNGEICTNRCPDRQTCTIKRIHFLIEAIDIIVSDIDFGEIDGIYYTSFKSDCIAPEAYINDLVFYMQENIYPHISSVPCAYCDKSFILPTSQKKKLLTDNYTKYYKTNYLYCSKECQEKHLKELAESKSVASGSLKNHESALIVHGADVTKRLKEKEVHIIVGNITEQRARCLYEKLISTIPRKKKRYLTSNEVQSFLLKDLPDSLKANENKIDVTAWYVMNKCELLFPMSISITRINKRTRSLELIE